MKNLIRNIIVILLLLWSCIVSAQSVTYRNLTTKDGLPSNTVYQIKQDNQGFIWIATDNGLVRYDGANFKKFNPKDVKDKEILGIYIDEDDETIWFWNLKGQLFYIKNEIVKPANFVVSNVKVSDIQQDSLGNYWYYSYDDGLFKVLNSKKSKFVYKPSSGKIMGLIINDNIVRVRNNSTIYSIVNNKLVDEYEIHEKIFKFKTQPKTYQFIFKYLNNQFWFLSTKTSRFFKVDGKGNFVAHGFQKFRTEFGENLNNIFTDNQKNYWLFTDEWIYVFDSTETKKLAKFKLPYNNNINTFFQDKEGNYWLSSPKHGIFILPSLYFTEATKLLENEAAITSLSIIDNIQLIGFENGKFIHRDISNHTTKIIDLKLNEPIKQFVAAKNNRVWINTNVRSYFYNLKTNELTRNFNNQVNINYKNVYIDDEQILIGNFSGVIQSSLSDVVGILKKLAWEEVQKNRIKGINKRVYAIEKVGQEYWFGSTDGLYYYKKDTAILTNIDLLKDSWITHIIYQKGTIWVGTQTDGVFEIKNKKIVNHYNQDKENGLISNNCKQLIVEPNGIVWVGTNDGINKINTKTNSVELINNLDGLSNNDIIALAIDNENVYVGTSENLTSFNKNIQTKNTVSPPIYFSSFQIFEKDTTLSESYILKHNENNIRIGFTGISFRSQGTIKYKYRMKGLSNDWSETTSDYVSYPVLNPDDYTFEAVAINEDGIESEVPIQVKITILQPFWQTWWFRLSVFIAFLLTVWAIAMSRVNRIRERLQLKNEYQQKINELEMQALQAQMNPHFIFNVLNSIQHYLTLNEGEQAMIYLAKFAKLIRMIFDFSRKPTISLYEEINFLNLYMEMEKLRFKQRIEIELIVDDNIDEEYIKIPPLMIQPLVENCFKHGLLHKENGGKVSVRFEENSQGIICIVEDNGIGRAAAKAIKSWKKKTHKSAGVNTTKERLELWLTQQTKEIPTNFFKVNDLQNEKGEAQGTVIELLLIYQPKSPS